MSKIAIIPARGGSKRIVGKNKKLFLGKPIISYSISSVINSEAFDEVMVSTDDEEIAAIAIENGASVPFMRSIKNANDSATLTDVLLEVIDEYKKIGKQFEMILCLLPTAPFVETSDITQAIKKINSEQFDAVFPVTEFSFPIQRALKIEDGNVRMVSEKYMNTRSQDLPTRYHDAGQFYLLKTESFLNQKKIYMEKSGAIISSSLKVQDIDSETDWKIAEMKYKIIMDEKENPY